MPWTNEFHISIAVLYISGLLIYPEIKIRICFLRIIKKLWLSTRIFGYIFINSIQPFEAVIIYTTFFVYRTMIKHNSCQKLINNLKTTFHALLLCILICEIGCTVYNQSNCACPTNNQIHLVLQTITIIPLVLQI